MTPLSYTSRTSAPLRPTSTAYRTCSYSLGAFARIRYIASPSAPTKPHTSRTSAPLLPTSSMSSIPTHMSWIPIQISWTQKCLGFRLKLLLLLEMPTIRILLRLIELLRLSDSSHPQKSPTNSRSNESDNNTNPKNVGGRRQRRNP